MADRKGRAGVAEMGGRELEQASNNVIVENKGGFNL